MKKLFIFIIFCLLALVSVNAQKKNNKTNVKRLKVGLVLGGGGAKGAAEVGVLKYIEKSGIPIDYIAGTSIGSIVGALYSVGYRADDLDSLFHSQEWISLLSDRDESLRGQILTTRDSVTYLFGFPVKRPKNKNPNHIKTIGLSRGDKLVSLFSSMLNQPDSINFDKLPIPFRCVAVDIRSFQEVVMSSGNLPKAMRASMAIPGVFKPVETDKMLLVDGGLLNNLPVDVVRDMGADVVIAIDLTQNKHEDKKVKKTAEDLADDNGLMKVLGWLSGRPDLNKYHDNNADVDVYINPNLKGFSAADFKLNKIEKMILQGEKAGKDSYKQIKALNKKIYK